jgi:hypothetical protein
VVIASSLLLGAPGNPAIRYAATLPGMYGSGVAFIAEVAISFALMLTVLFASNHAVLSRYTPYFVGALYAIFINGRNTAIRNEYESRPNLWLGISRPLLACPLDLFRGTDSRHVGCCRTLSSGARRHRLVLRQALSC